MNLPLLKGPAAAFYGFCRQQELRFQRCASCHAWRHPPRPLCNACHSFETEWARVSGGATLHAWTVAVAPMGPALADKVPYVAAVVELDEGPRMATWVTGVGEGDLRVGMRLQVWFEEVSPEVALAKFRPA